MPKGWLGRRERNVWEETDNKVNRGTKAGNTASNSKSFAKTLPTLHSTVSRIINHLMKCWQREPWASCRHMVRSQVHFCVSRHLQFIWTSSPTLAKKELVSEEEVCSCVPNQIMDFHLTEKRQYLLRPPCTSSSGAGLQDASNNRHLSRILSSKSLRLSKQYLLQCPKTGFLERNK